MIISEIQTFPLAESGAVIAPFPRMQLPKRLAPGPTDLIDWLNAEGVMDLDWDFPTDGDLFAAGLDSPAVVQLMVAAIEDKYGIQLGPDDLAREHLATPQALAAMLARKLA